MAPQKPKRVFQGKNIKFTITGRIVHGIQLPHLGCREKVNLNLFEVDYSSLEKRVIALGMRNQDEATEPKLEQGSFKAPSNFNKLNDLWVPRIQR